MDLPAASRGGPFTEVDGTVGRVVLVYPPEKGLSVWNGRDLLRIAVVLQLLHLPDGKVIETSGSAVVFGAMIRSVLHDGPLATAVSLSPCLILVLLVIRPLAAALVAVGILLLGVCHGRRRRLGARPRHLPELHRAAHHLRHRRRVRAQRRDALPRGAGHPAVRACRRAARSRSARGRPSSATARCSRRATRRCRASAPWRSSARSSCLSAAIVALPAFIIWSQRRGASGVR